MTLAVLSLAAALLGPVAVTDARSAANLSWMAGYWLSCEGDREVSETWSDSRGGLMLGNALTLTGGQASYESARIGPVPHSSGADTEGVIAYFAQVGDDPAVVFPVVQVSASRVVFENPGHDFPQRVIYERDGDVLKARIEGHMGDRMQSMDWRYHKADLNARCPA